MIRPESLSGENSSPSPTLFGQRLQDVMKRRAEASNFVPRYVSLMLKAIRQNLTRTGIFRLYGDMEEMMFLKERIDSGRLNDFATVRNPNTITSLFKEYLRCLPEQDYDYQAYFDPIEDIGGVFGVTKKKIRYCHSVLFPRIHPFDLQFLFEFFRLCRDIAAHRKRNKMSVKNLSICLAISLFKFNTHDSMSPMVFIKLTPRIQSVFSFFVEKFDRIFPGGKRPELPEGLWYEEDVVLDEKEWIDRVRWLLGGEEEVMELSESNHCWTASARIVVSDCLIWRCWKSLLVSAS